MRGPAVLLTTLLILLALPGVGQTAQARLLYDHNFRVYKVVDLGVEKPIKGLKALSAQLTALKELHRCFNCSFPVGGAPKAYPKNGQLLPLVACASGLFCRKAPVRFYSHPERLGFLLIAQRGHFDGAGSIVEFRFFGNNNRELMLRVTANVMKPSVPDWANKSFAASVWGTFGRQMGYNLYTYQYCRYIC